MRLSAPELYRRGRADLNAGRNAAARRALALAAARTDDRDLRARIAGSLAAVTMRQGDPATAARLCHDALALGGLTRQTAAMLHGQLGLLALERGDLDDAVAWLDRAIAGIGDEAEHRAPMLLNRSVAHMQAGRLADSRADLERAAPDYAATGNAVEQAMAVHNAGYAALLEGDLVRALETMGEAHAVLASASAVNAAICDRDRAEVLRDAGLTREAEESLERVAHVFGAHRMRQARGEAEFHLARSLLSHDPPRAALVAASASRRFDRIGSESWALRADAVRLRAQLTEDAAGRGAGGRARGRSPLREDVERVVAALAQKRLRGDAAALHLSWELYAATRRPSAEVTHAPIRIPRDASIQVRLLGHEVRAARAEATGTDADVRRHASAGLEELARWQASFGSLDLATSLVMHGDRLIYTGLQAAARSRRPEVVFEWSERARHLSQQVVPLRPPPDRELAADLAELRQLRFENGSGEWLSDPRALELSERVRRRQWSATRVAGRRERISLEELRSHLADDTVFISYIFDGGRLLALAATAATAHVVTIERWPEVVAAMAGLRADLDVVASIRTGPMAATVRGALEDRLAVLSAALLDPISGIIGGRRTAITAPGILGGLPWGMLPAMRGRVLTVATSATQWVADRGRSPAAGVGLVAGPNVARSEEEVARAAAAWSATQILDPAHATVEATTELAAGVGVLHVAAHGRHAVEHPLFSGLELADGTLFGYDIDLMRDVPATVVLSACEVGRSSVRWRHEAIGMTRTWLHAGTRCVIATPVIVADDVACELLGAMHEGLAAGQAPAVALAQATEQTGIVSPFQAHGTGF